MRFLLKSILRSIWEKKTYTLLIVCSIMGSSAMFFASLSISGTLIQLRTDSWRSSSGYSDIVIQAGKDSSSGFFYRNGAEKYAANMEYCVGQISGYAVYRTNSGERKSVSLKGMDLDGLQQLTPLAVLAENGLYPFIGRKLLIGKATAESYRLEAGDSIVLEINGQRCKFSIAGIAENKGPFAGESRSFCAVVPLETMQALYDARGRVDRLYIKLLHPELKSRMILRLVKEYSRLSVREAFTEEEIRRQTDSIAAPILIVAFILSFMSIYIIYTTFKVIVAERLPVIAAFRSIGAEKRTSEAILFSESLFYGFAGGGLGCVAGILLLYWMSWVMSPETAGKTLASLHFSAGQLAAAFLLAVLLSLAGSLVPVLQTSGSSIKSLMGGLSEERQSAGKLRNGKGTALVLSAFLLPLAVTGSFAKWVDAACILALLFGILLLLPSGLKAALRPLTPLYRLFFGNLGPFALKNLQENRNLINNISLLLIGISTLFMISTLNYGETRQILDCFDRCRYDIHMQLEGTTQNTLQLIRSTEGVADVYADYVTSGISVEGQDDLIWHFEGIEPAAFAEHFDLRLVSQTGNALKELDSGRNILLSTTLRSRYGLELNDSVSLVLRSSSGSKLKRQYRVTGFFENIFPGQWSYALISAENYRLDIGRQNDGQVFIKAAGSVDDAVASLQSAFGRRKPDIRTIDEQKQEVAESNRQLFLILEGFSIMALCSGASGITNNLIICFLQRKRTFAILRSIGMSRRQNFLLILLESVTGGVIGGMAGVGAGFLITLLIVPRIMKALQIETRIYFSGQLFVLCAGLGFLITAAASVIPASRLRRLNTIEALKYE